MISRLETEYRCYGLYSDVAKETGYTVSQIDTVYSWYLQRTITDAIEKPTCQLYFKNLGMLQINLTSAISVLNKNAYGMQECYNHYLDGTGKSYITVSYLTSKVKGLIKATDSLKQRVIYVRERNVINETRYLNVTTKIEKLELTLNRLYESIQRIPEYEQKRTAECRQSAPWGDEQSSELFQTVEP